MIADQIIVRTAELCLKGHNRGFFERQLMADIRRRLAGMTRLELKRDQGKTLISRDGGFTPEQAATASAALAQTFGISNFSIVSRCERNVAAVAKLAAAWLTSLRQGCGGQAGKCGRLRVTVNREDKTYPRTSIEISQDVAEALLPQISGWTVDLHDPDVVVEVTVTPEYFFVAVGREAGPGGLPVGTAGRVAVLLSGGIDSPVAAWKMMRRGAEAVFVHCHSYPYVSEASIAKVKRLAAQLSEWQGGATLFLVPLADLQREIAAKCDEALRIVLYRRMMLRLAERAAAQTGALGLVTGDSLGQVASQTLENMRTVSQAGQLPIYRPLVSDDKEDIVRIAKKIGTYKISIENQDDCCSLFMPRSPATRATPERALAEEAKLDVIGLVAAAWQAAERMII